MHFMCCVFVHYRNSYWKSMVTALKPFFLDIRQCCPLVVIYCNRNMFNVRISVISFVFLLKVLSKKKNKHTNKNRKTHLKLQQYPLILKTLIITTSMTWRACCWANKKIASSKIYHLYFFYTSVKKQKKKCHKY